MGLVTHSKHFHEVSCSVQLQIGGHFFLLPSNLRLQTLIPTSFYFQNCHFLKHFKHFASNLGDGYDVSLLIGMFYKKSVLVIDGKKSNDDGKQTKHKLKRKSEQYAEIKAAQKEDRDCRICKPNQRQG
jgi:hypothetical protein